MTAFIIVLSCIFWCASMLLLMSRWQLLAPASSYAGLLTVSFATENGYPLLPVNNTIILAWLCMTLIVMVATVLQPDSIRQQTRGTAYITVGALTGMAVGLLGYTVSDNINLLYGIMIVATVAGTFFGFLLFSNTPGGRNVSLGSGNFLRYLAAKGFPAAISVMILGIVFVLLIAMHVYHAIPSI